MQQTVQLIGSVSFVPCIQFNWREGGRWGNLRYEHLDICCRAHFFIPTYIGIFFSLLWSVSGGVYSMRFVYYTGSCPTGSGGGVRRDGMDGWRGGGVQKNCRSQYLDVEKGFGINRYGTPRRHK